MSIEQGPFGGSYRADIKVELQVPTWPNKNDTHVKIIRITCTIGNQTVEVLQLNTSSIGAVVSGGGTSKWQDYTCPPTNMTGGWVVGWSVVLPLTAPPVVFLFTDGFQSVIEARETVIETITLSRFILKNKRHLRF